MKGIITIAVTIKVIVTMAKLEHIINLSSKRTNKQIKKKKKTFEKNIEKKQI